MPSRRAMHCRDADVSQAQYCKCVSCKFWWYCTECQLWTNWWYPSPPIDSIWALVLVWRIRRKIIRTALCCVVYNICAQWHAHTCEQFLHFCMLVRFRFLVCVFISVSSFVWSFMLAYIILKLKPTQQKQYKSTALIVLGLFCTKARYWLGRTSQKWPILC